MFFSKNVILLNSMIIGLTKDIIFFFLATKRARIGDLFITRARDRQVTVAPYEETDSFTFMPYPGFEPGILGVAVGSPIHYTSWSAHCISILWHFHLLGNNFKSAHIRVCVCEWDLTKLTINKLIYKFLYLGNKRKFNNLMYVKNNILREHYKF